MINGNIILVTTAVLMMTTGAVETFITMILTAAAFTVSSQHTACTALTASTAEGVALAPDRSRYTSIIYCYNMLRVVIFTILFLLCSQSYFNISLSVIIIWLFPPVTEPGI